MATGYRFGPFILDLQNASLSNGGNAVTLRPKAFDALRHLAAHPGRLLTKDELVAAVWPDTIVNDDALAQCIRDIRRALGDDGTAYVRTVPRRGYVFVAETTTLDRPATAPHRDRLTVAVLPFASFGTAEAWLGEGVAEDITTALARFRELAVISSNSTFHYRDDGADPAAIGRDLGANFVLRGSVRRGPDRLRVTVQLIDTLSGATRWARHHDRPPGEVTAIEEDVANEIAAHLVAEIRDATAARATAQAPSNLDAYELVLRARKAYRAYSAPEMLAARDLLERAIAIQPDYAAAWELLARLRLQLYIQPFDEAVWARPETLASARAAAHKAIDLDPGFSTAHAALGSVHMWAREYDAALAELRRALDRNPTDTTTLGLYADALSRAGFQHESLAVYEEAERLDPFPSPIAAALKARTHNLLREFAPALVLARSSIETAPRLLPGLLHLTIAAIGLDRVDKAQEVAGRLIAAYPRFSIRAHLALVAQRRPEDTQFLFEHLARAGLPE